MAKSRKTSPENSLFMLYVVMNDDSKHYYYSQPHYDTRGKHFQFEYLLNNVLLGKTINNNYKLAIFYNNKTGTELTRVAPGAEINNKLTRSYYKLLVILPNNDFRYIFCNPEYNQLDKNTLFEQMIKTEVIEKLNNQYKTAIFYDVRTDSQLFSISPNNAHKLNSRYKLFIDVNGIKKCRLYIFSFPSNDHKGPEFQFNYMKKSILEKKLRNNFIKAIFEDTHTKEIIHTIFNH